jgi:hypothetical protein
MTNDEFSAMRVHHSSFTKHCPFLNFEENDAFLHHVVVLFIIYHSSFIFIANGWRFKRSTRTDYISQKYAADYEGHENGIGC